MSEINLVEITARAFLESTYPGSQWNDDSDAAKQLQDIYRQKARRALIIIANHITAELLSKETDHDLSAQN